MLESRVRACVRCSCGFEKLEYGISRCVAPLRNLHQALVEILSSAFSNGRGTSRSLCALSRNPRNLPLELGPDAVVCCLHWRVVVCTDTGALECTSGEDATPSHGFGWRWGSD